MSRKFQIRNQRSIKKESSKSNNAKRKKFFSKKVIAATLFFFTIGLIGKPIFTSEEYSISNHIINTFSDKAEDDPLMQEAMLVFKRERKIEQLRKSFINSPAKYAGLVEFIICLLYTSPSPRDQRGSRMPSSA